MLRHSVQNRLCKTLDLSLVDMCIGTKDAVILSITHAETFHLAGAQIPGIEGLANHTAVFTVHLKALMPVHPHRHRQVKVTNAAIGEFSRNKPAIGSELFDESGLDTDDLAAQKAGRIDEVTGVPQEIVALPVCFRIACWSPGMCTRDGNGLEVVGFDIAVRRVAVPGFEREELSDLFLDELVGEGDAWVEALHRPDLEHKPRRLHVLT